jgi:RNA recognition motif-containing protein
MPVNIYVGNLSYDVTETQLEELFAQHGEVTSVKIIIDQFSGKSRGFAFIEMSDNNEAQSAIQELNGSSFLDRALKVNMAKPRNESRRSNRY